MTIYEEVARMPPFHRKTLVLVGEYELLASNFSIEYIFQAERW